MASGSSSLPEEETDLFLSWLNRPEVPRTEFVDTELAVLMPGGTEEWQLSEAAEPGLLALNPGVCEEYQQVIGVWMPWMRSEMDRVMDLLDSILLKKMDELEENYVKKLRLKSLNQCGQNVLRHDDAEDVFQQQDEGFNSCYAKYKCSQTAWKLKHPDCCDFEDMLVYLFFFISFFDLFVKNLTHCEITCSENHLHAVYARPYAPFCV